MRLVWKRKHLDWDFWHFLVIWWYLMDLQGLLRLVCLVLAMFTSTDDIRLATSAKKGPREGSITGELQQKVPYFSKVSTSNCVFLIVWLGDPVQLHFNNFTSWILSQLSQLLWSIVLVAPWALYLPSPSDHGRSMQPRFILRWSGHWPNWPNRWWQSMKNLWQKT